MFANFCLLIFHTRNEESSVKDEAPPQPAVLPAPTESAVDILVKHEEEEEELGILRTLDRLEGAAETFRCSFISYMHWHWHWHRQKQYRNVPYSIAGVSHA